MEVLDGEVYGLHQLIETVSNRSLGAPMWCRCPDNYNLSWFHRDQHIVDAHSDNFQIDVMLFLLSHNILICGAICYGQEYQRLLIIDLVDIPSNTSEGKKDLSGYRFCQHKKGQLPKGKRA